MSKSESLIFIGMDVHQDTVTLAVFEGASKETAVVQKLPNDLRKLRRSSIVGPSAVRSARVMKPAERAMFCTTSSPSGGMPVRSSHPL